MTKHRLRWIVSLCIVICLGSCTKIPEQIEPKIDCAVQDRYLLQLPSPFAPLSEEEKKQEWAKEYKIAMGFAHELDLYQAITGFKRTLFLLPKSDKQRKLELQYEMLLCYYIAQKYTEVIQTYEDSGLHFVVGHFVASHDLLTILFDSYSKIHEIEKAQQVLEYMQVHYPQTAQKLQLSSAIVTGDLQQIQSYTPEYPYLSFLLDCYEQKKKSISKARALNACLPGAGYLYLGQKGSALTAFLLNGLFIGATYYFFHTNNVCAGILFAGFEAGWYFGGIHGAALEAKFYNERMYEQCATPLMNEYKLFPLFSLQYAF